MELAANTSRTMTTMFLALPITFNLNPADLKPTKIGLPNTTITSTTPNPTVDLSWTVANRHGTDDPPAVARSRLRLVQAGSDWIRLKPFINRRLTTRRSRRAAANRASGPVRLPVTASGTYYIFVKTNYDGTGGQYEPDYVNNVPALPFIFNLTPADLKPTKITLPSATITSNAPNPTIDLSWTVANIGTGPTTPRQWRDLVYVSAKPVLDDTAQPFYQSSPYDQTVPPGGSYTVPPGPVRLPLTASEPIISSSRPTSTERAANMSRTMTTMSSLCRLPST